MLAIGVVLTGPGPAPLLAAAGPAAAAATIARRRRAYIRAVERGLPEIALAIADALGAGRSPRAALAAAVASLEGPPAAEMARVRAELALGMPTRDALEELRERLGSSRVDAFTGALRSQQISGGDLAELLRRFAAAAADRDRTEADARSATAQARFTGLLVVALPAGAALLAELLQPGFIAGLLEDPAAATLLALAAALQLAGFAAIRRLSRVGP
jgi:tight adherence protein B